MNVMEYIPELKLVLKLVIKLVTSFVFSFITKSLGICTANDSTGVKQTAVSQI